MKKKRYVTYAQAMAKTGLSPVLINELVSCGAVEHENGKPELNSLLEWIQRKIIKMKSNERELI